MREMHLNAVRATGELVASIRNGGPVTSLTAVQGDLLQIYVHNLLPNTAVPAPSLYTEFPLSATGIRASVGYIDAAPTSGTFRLKVGDQTTAELAWPADLSTANLRAAWKTTVLNALKALSNVADGDIRLDDPADTPGHLFYFSWTDPERDDAIEVVSNRLLPWIEPTVTARLIPVGFTQLVKLARFPIQLSDAFAQATTPPVLIIETVPGSTGTNAEQTIIIPATAAGTVSFGWTGASTKAMSVDTMTAGSLSDALNAIVPGGDIEPRFQVETRTQRDGKRFAVEFIGPLGSAAQPLLARTMRDQQGAPYWTGTLPLDGLGTEMALNGAAQVILTFELVITESGEETYLRPFILQNDMTGPGTVTDAEESGGIIIRERIVYIGQDLGEPFAEVAPGYTFASPGAGNPLAVNHGLGTFEPTVKITLFEVDHEIFAAELLADPEDVQAALDAAITGSRELHTSEYTAHADTAALVTITLPWVLVDDPEDPHDFRLIRVRIGSPDAALMLYPHLHDWDHVLEAVPGGQTLRAKLAAIEARIGELSGDLKIPPTSLDIPALIRAILALLKLDPTLRTLFIDLLKTVITNSELVRLLISEFSKYSEFTEVVKKTFESSELIKKLVEELKKSVEFMQEIRSLVFEALLTGASLPPGLVVFQVDDFHLQFPPVKTIEGGSTQVTVGQVTTTTTSGTDAQNVTQTVSTAPQTIDVPSIVRRFEALPVALVGVALGAEITGEISATTMTDNTVRTVGTAGARTRTMGRRRGQGYEAGTILARKNGIVFPVRKHDAGTNTWWPVELEESILPLTIYEDQLDGNSRLSIGFVAQVQLLGGVAGKIDLALEMATMTTGSQGSQETAALAEVHAQTLPLCASRSFHQFAIEILRETDEEDVITTTGKVIYREKETVFIVPALPFKLNLATRRFDAENISGAAGSVIVDIVAPIVSVAPTA